MAQSVNLSAPYAGFNTKTPVAALQSPQSQVLFNFNLTSGGIKLRNGDSIFKNISLGFTAGSSPVQFFQYGDVSLFAMVYKPSSSENKLYNLGSGSNVYTTAAMGVGAFFPQEFNNYLFFFSSTTAYAPGFYFDGTSFGNIGYTTATTFTPINGGNSYKSRNYIIQSQEPAYWYSGIASVSGPLTKVDLTSVISQATILSNIIKITLSDVVQSVEIQCFIFSNGEILFYTGDYPDADNWELVGRAVVGTLLSTIGKSVFRAQGDGFVICDSGILSLRDLFLKGGQNAKNLSINSNIQPFWAAAIKAARAFLPIPTGPLSTFWGVFDSINSRLVICAPFSFNPADPSLPIIAAGNTYFIYDMLQEAWYLHNSAGSLKIWDGVFFINKILYFGTLGFLPTTITVSEKEGATNYTDRSANDSSDIAYDYQMLSAPIPFPKTAVVEANQIEPIIYSDLYAQTNWNFVVDLGRQTSGNQPTDAITTAVAKPAVNVGMQNITYLQVKMSGTTTTGKTVGLTLYSYNVWFDRGEIASR